MYILQWVFENTMEWVQQSHDLKYYPSILIAKWIVNLKGVFHWSRLDHCSHPLLEWKRIFDVAIVSELQPSLS